MLGLRILHNLLLKEYVRRLKRQFKKENFVLKKQNLNKSTYRRILVRGRIHNCHSIELKQLRLIIRQLKQIAEKE